MPRKKGTPNASPEIIQEIIAKHQAGATKKESENYKEYYSREVILMVMIRAPP